MNNHIELHSKDSFLKMHDAGKLAAEVLDYITDYVKPNVSTGYLNDLCHEFILKNDAIPARIWIGNCIGEKIALSVYGSCEVVV